eukprot:TRINITY_DN14454_c0_g1_i1.p1 TRINITY_DN14454_c0_g1~~TRINITY_DN14454_c0_g1_i1.p1  ORF type:complete len:292 (+),score=75.12 TRINITY_DN14454_c0_g1_i1:78-953(+)
MILTMKNYRSIAIVALLCAFVAATPLIPRIASDLSYEGDRISAQILGQSGKITFWSHTANSTKFTFEMDSLIEYDSNGGKIKEKGHSFETFANQDFTFTPIDSDAKYQNVSADNVDFYATLVDPGSSGPNAKLRVEMYFFTEDGNFTIGGEDYQVNEDTFKFNLRLEDWDWCTNCGSGANQQTGSYIIAQFKMKSNSKIETEDDDAKFYLGSNTEFELAEKIDIDGTFKDAEVDAAVNGQQLVVKIKIPRFTNYAHYDPTTFFNKDDKGWGMTSTANLPLIVMLLLAALLF